MLFDDALVLAKDSTTPRATKDRFADIINVKDFGATGDGTTDDRAAIQAAIDWSVSSDRQGILFFPAGDYHLEASLIYGIEAPFPSIIFRGVGKASQISGNFNGFLLDRSVETSPGLDNSNPAMCAVERLSFYNQYNGSASAGCVRWTIGHGIVFSDCAFRGFKGVDTSAGTFGLVLYNCHFVGLPGINLGSHGLIANLGGPGDCLNCSFTGFHTGISTGPGLTAYACKFVNNGNGFVVSTSGGGHAICCDFEANDCGIWLNNAYFSEFASCVIRGGLGCIYTGYGAGGTGPLEGVTSDPATKWSTYGIFVGSYGQGNKFQSCRVSGDFNVAGIHHNIGTDSMYTWIGCLVRNDGNSLTDSTTTWEFGGTSMSGQSLIGCNPHRSTIATFAGLPIAGVPAFADYLLIQRSEGMEYGLSDADLTGKAFGDAITAGGSTGHIKVRFNGTSWIWCA